MNWTWKKLLPVSFFSAVLIFGGILAVLHQPNYDYAPEPVEDPNVTATYNEENGSITVTVVNGTFTSESKRVFFSEDIAGRGENLSLKGYGETKDTSIWAENSFLGLEFLDNGITDFKIREGESVTVESTESSEIDKLYLQSKYQDISATVRIFNVQNESIVS